jgi:thiol-disulfide isomerase/thioredoxin
MNMFLKTKLRMALCFCLLAGGLIVAWAGGFKAGDTLPELSTFELEGTLPSSLSGKVIVLDFWASWCSPCAQSFPVLDDLQKKHAEQGVVVLAVSVDEKAEAMRAFLKKHPVTFSVMRDAKQKLVAAADVKTMPTTLIIDQEGKVRFVHNGFRGEETRKQLSSEIESLLKQKL